MIAVLIFIHCTALLLSVVICFYLPAPIHLAHLLLLSRCDITQLSWHLIRKKKKNNWNALPEYYITCNSVNAFKKHLNETETRNAVI